MTGDDDWSSFAWFQKYPMIAFGSLVFPPISFQKFNYCSNFLRHK